MVPIEERNVTKNYCDKCGTEIPERGYAHKFGLELATHTVYLVTTLQPSSHSGDLCRKCVAEALNATVERRVTKKSATKT